VDATGGTGCSASAGAAAPSAPPQLEQNRASARFDSPQVGQLTASGVPQLSQKRLPDRFSVPHPAQRVVDPSVAR